MSCDVGWGPQVITMRPIPGCHDLLSAVHGARHHVCCRPPAALPAACQLSLVARPSRCASGRLLPQMYCAVRVCENVLLAVLRSKHPDYLLLPFSLPPPTSTLPLAAARCLCPRCLRERCRCRCRCGRCCWHFTFRCSVPSVSHGSVLRGC